MLDGYMASQLCLQGGWMEDLLLNYPNVAKCTIHWVLGMPTTIGTQKAGCSRIVQRLFAGCIVILDDEKSYQLFNFNGKKKHFIHKKKQIWHDAWDRFYVFLDLKKVTNCGGGGAEQWNWWWNWRVFGTWTWQSLREVLISAFVMRDAWRSGNEKTWMWQPVCWFTMAGPAEMLFCVRIR